MLGPCRQDVAEQGADDFQLAFVPDSDGVVQDNVTAGPPGPRPLVKQKGYALH
jgi:hypothetical protein